jgi:hypothetical protein
LDRFNEAYGVDLFEISTYYNKEYWK